MNIIETKIPDVTKNNIDESKKVLAENIIKNVYPLFNEIYIDETNKIKVLKNELKQKKNNISDEKKLLENLINEYRKKKKVSKLLDRIEKLVTSGLVYDGSIKHEITILLKVIDKISSEKLDYHLKEILKTISKRFSR